MSTNRIITAGEEFPIQPHHIDASKHLYDAFDNLETEVSAGWIVRFMQQRNQGWNPFTEAEIEAFYSKKFSHGFCFNRLVEPQMVPPSLARPFAGHYDEPIPVGGGWIVKGDDEKYYVTVDFVTRCYKSGLKQPEKVATN